MARGFESKDVEFQQAEAERKKTFARNLTDEERRGSSEVQRIRLSLNHVRNELAGAVQPAHRQMLERAMVDLEAQLASAQRAYAK